MNRVLSQLVALLVSALPWATPATPAHPKPEKGLSSPFAPVAVLGQAASLPGPPAGAPATAAQPAEPAVLARPRPLEEPVAVAPRPRAVARLYLSFASLQLDGG